MPVKVKVPNKIKCLVCGWEWIPRKPIVIRCAKCKSPYFDRRPKAKVGKVVVNGVQSISTARQENQ